MSGTISAGTEGLGRSSQHAVPESDSSGIRPRIAVIGGGISGLASAWMIRQLLPLSDLTVFEASGRLGGCIRSTDLDGALPIRTDVGAEAALARRSEVVDLAGQLDLVSVNPSSASSSIFARGNLRPDADADGDGGYQRIR